MANDINGELRNVLPGNIDYWNRVYATVADANAAIPSNVVGGRNFREGKVVQIGREGNSYKWIGDFTDLNLLPLFNNNVRDIFKYPDSSFSAAETVAIYSLRSVRIRSTDMSQKYSLNYIRRGNSSVSSVISFKLTDTGQSFSGDFGNGTLSGIHTYQVQNTYNDDIITVTIDWDLIRNIGNQLIISDHTKSEFLDSCYDLFTQTPRHLFEDPLYKFRTNELQAVNSMIDAYVKIRNVNIPDYGLRYIQKGSASVVTSISIFTNRTGSSFAASFAVGVPVGIQTYECIESTTRNKVFVTIDWNKSLIPDGARVELNIARGMFSKAIYTFIPELRTDLFNNNLSVFSEGELGALRGIQDVSVKSRSETFLNYSFRYIKRGSATEPTVISFYYGPATSSAATTFAIGAVSGIVDYTYINPNTNDEIAIRIDWDKTNLAAGEQRDFSVNRSLLSKSIYTVFTGLQGIRMNLFEDTTGSSFNDSNKGLARGIVDVFVKSKSSEFTNYSIRYFRRGSASVQTTISIFNYATDTSSVATNYGIGVVSGIQKYTWINTVNGDEIYFTINWDKTDIAAGEQREVTRGRMLLSKSLYYYAGGGGGIIPDPIELVLPDVIPVAKGIFLPVFPESIRNLSTTDERNTRVDISGGGITVPFSNYAQPWKYQFNVTPPAQFNLTVTNKTLDGSVINSETFPVKPVTDVYNSAIEVPIMLLGSSSIDIANAVLGRELRATIVAKNSFIPKFIGTRSGTQGGVTVSHEGYPGSTTRDFLSSTLPIGSSTTVPNPFYIGGAFNFSGYMAANGFTGCNHLYIMLLTNDIYLIADGTITANDVVNNLKAIIQSAWSYNPNMNCSVILPQLGDMSQDSGALIKSRLVSLLKVVKAAFAGDIFKSATNKPAKLCNVFQSVDRVNGYGTTSASRTGLTYPFDSTHPNLDQYRGISDIIFSHLMMDLTT